MQRFQRLWPRLLLRFHQYLRILEEPLATAGRFYFDGNTPMAMRRPSGAVGRKPETRSTLSRTFILYPQVSYPTNRRLQNGTPGRISSCYVDLHAMG